MTIISKEIINSLLSYATNDGIEDPDYSIEPGSQKGDNFMGIISKLKVENEDSTKILSIIIKMAASDPQTRLVLGTKILFGREVWVYKNLMPIYKQNKHSFDTNLKFPNCIQSCDTDNNEWLAFNDLCSEGFKLHRPRLAAFDEDHICVALAALAEFHVLSVVFKKSNPENFNDFIQLTTDIIFTNNEFDEKYKTYLNQAVDKAIQVVKNTDHKKRLQDLSCDIYEQIVEVVKPNEFAVFCHGDFWKNNMMFKYEEGVPISVCPIDYQVVRASSPATDILYVIFSCTTQGERKTKYIQFLRSYYIEFCKQSYIYELNENLFTWAEFLGEIRRCSIFGLGMAMMVLPFMTYSDNVPEAEDILSGTAEDDNESLILYTERIEGVVEDFVTYGYI